jgi:hypothetical protein
MPDDAGETDLEGLLGFPLDAWLGISGSALKECYVALGVVSARWNAAEGMMRLLVGHYAKIPKPFGAVVTRYLGNVSMVDLLSECAEIVEADNPDFLQAIKFLCVLFSRCRENRNLLIHSHLVLNIEKRAADRIEKPPNPRSAEARRYSCTADDIRRIADDIERLHGVFVNLAHALQIRDDPSSHTSHTPADLLRLCKFQLPNKLNLLPPEAQEDAPLQQQSPKE